MEKSKLIRLALILMALFALVWYFNRPKEAGCNGCGVPLPTGWEVYQADKDKSTGFWRNGYWIEEGNDAGN